MVRRHKLNEIISQIKSLTGNIRKRRGEKVAIEMPIYQVIPKTKVINRNTKSIRMSEK